MLKTVIKILIPLLLFFALFSFRLDKVPVHLNQDELMFTLNAKAIAETGRDYYGSPLPFYFWHLDHFWATPVIIYSTSILLKFLPVSEFSIRIPTVAMAFISIVLTFLLVKRMFGSSKLAMLSGVLLALTPAFFINSRLLLDNLYILPFVLIWLLFLDTNPFLSGLSLGFGIHSYHAAKIYMPIYFIMSFLYLLPVRKKSIPMLILGFAIPILLLLPWLKNHPDTLTNQVSYASSINSSTPGGKTLGSNFIRNYFSYFDPRIIFSEGDKTLIHSTGKTGIFLFPTVFLITFGILSCLRSKDRFSKIIVFGFLTYPIAPAIIDDPGRISRALVVIPFATILSIYGIKFLAEQKDKIFKYLLTAIFLASILQFTVFLTDYFGNYRVRSYEVFNRDIGGAFESALRSTEIRKVDSIYLDSTIPFADYYWVFYQKKLGITFENTKDYDFRKEAFSDLPPHSLLVTGQKIENVEPIEIIRESDGRETYFVYEKIK